jgi:general secretion pathway protein A
MNDAISHLASLGLQRNPFPPTPDARCYFYTSQLDRDFAEVLHCVEARKGFVLLTGEVGLGKSTFVRRLLDAVGSRSVVAAMVFNTFLQGRELLAAINRDFGLAPQDGMAADMAALNAFLIAQARAGKTSLLIVDDAQNLAPESLELVRLLCNLESGQEKLLQIVLAGQPELLDTLEKKSLRQLKSRVVKHVHLEGLSLRESGRYFDFRVTEAGGAGRISLHPSALKILHRATGGNPRRIHLVLDRCLYGLLARRSTVITPALLQEALADVAINGVRPRRNGLRYWLAATLLMPLLGYAAWNAGRDARTSPAASVDADAKVSAAAPNSLATCMDKLAQFRPAEVQTVRLPEVLASRIMHDPAMHDPATCLYRADDATWVLWQPRLRATDMLSPQPNDAVREMQAMLSRLGLIGPVAADGWFGPLTREGLARFQARNGLPAKGEPDDVTLLLLEKSR